jgi:ATP-dependent DNA helicase PIF1
MIYILIYLIANYNIMKKNSMTDIRDFYHHNANNENENENENEKIVNNITNGNIQPSAKGQRWSVEEDSQLLDELKKEISIPTIAKIHNRTYGGIKSHILEIACKMMNNHIPMEEIIQSTKLDEIQINEAMEKKKYYQQKTQVNRNVKAQEKAEKAEKASTKNENTEHKNANTSSDEVKHTDTRNIIKHKLSIEQECALQQFENGDNLFITGEGGTGKTLLIRHLVKSSIHRGRKIQVCAMTGCAALLLECNARTIHSWSGIRLGKGEIEDIIGTIVYNHVARNAWRNTDVLIVDEVSMMSKRIFELLNIVGKRLRKCYSKPFGGLQVVFVGDFFQLPPVCMNNAQEGEDLFCFESEDWLHTFPMDNHIVLKTMFRQDDSVFRRILGNIRMGNVVTEDVTVLKKYINRTFDSEKYQGIIPTKLYPTKNKVDNVNREMFQQLKGDSYTFQFVTRSNCDKYMDGSDKEIPPNVLSKCRKNLTVKKLEFESATLANNSPCVKTLELKVGANVMCTVNLDLENGICNGSIGKVVDFIKDSKTPSNMVPVVLFSNGYTLAMSAKYWQSEDYPTIAVGQYPLCLAWAMTIHKIQGATLSMAEIDIGRGIFECGQTYVALSRVKNMEGLYLSNFEPNKIKTNKKVKQFYQEIPEVEYEVEYEVEEEIIHDGHEILEPDEYIVDFTNFIAPEK